MNMKVNFIINGFNIEWHKMFKCPYCGTLDYIPMNDRALNMFCYTCQNTFEVLANLVNADEELEKINKKGQELIEKTEKLREAQRNRMIEYRKLGNIHQAYNVKCSLTTVIITAITSVVLICFITTMIIEWIF